MSEFIDTPEGTEPVSQKNAVSCSGNALILETNSEFVHIPIRKSSKVVLASPYNGDWESLIVDGKILIEGHSLSAQHVLTALGIQFESYTPGPEDGSEEDQEEAWFEYLGQFDSGDCV